MATASTPSPASRSAIASTSASSSGLTIDPSTRNLSCTSMHCDRGTSGRIGGALILYIAMRLPRPTTSTSLWPAVTRTASRAPSRSSAVLVATVVPCTMRPSLLASTPRRLIPARMPSDWLRGVEGVFKTRSLPPAGSNSTRSVNVPPTSTPSQSIPSASSTSMRLRPPLQNLSLSSRASCPGSIYQLAPTFPNTWIPVTSTGMTVSDWRSVPSQPERPRLAMAKPPISSAEASMCCAVVPTRNLVHDDRELGTIPEYSDRKE